MDAILEILAEALLVGLGYFISLYLLIRVNYFPTTKKSGFIKLFIVLLLCIFQGGCNHIFANFIERDRQLEEGNILALICLVVLFLLALIKVYKKPESKIEKWPLLLLFSIVSVFIVIYIFGFFFS